MMKKFACLLAVAAFAVPAMAGSQASLFQNSNDFDTAINDAGKILKGVEDFENATTFPVPGAPGPLAGPLADPLQAGVANLDFNGVGFENGLVNSNLQLQSNVFGSDPFDIAGGGGLIVLGPNFLPGQTSHVVGANTFTESTDLLFPDGDKTAVSLDLFSNGAVGDVQVTVFDVDGIQILQDVVSGVSTSGSFVGVISDVAIGRINVADLEEFGELVDNIALYQVPEPATLGLLAMGAMVVSRRRR